MSVFSGKVNTAYYINDACDTIRIEYTDNNKRLEYVIPADKKNHDFQLLQKEGWDNEKLAEGTDKFRRDNAAHFSNIVNQEVAGRVDEIMKRHGIENYQRIVKEKNEKYSEGINHSKLWDVVMKKNAEKDDVFSFKMWAIETEVAQKSTPELKKQLRKAKTILEGITIYNNMMNG